MAVPKKYLLGMNAKLYYGTAQAALSTLAEMTNVRDLSQTMEAGEADITTRANDGWEASASTLRTLSAEFETVWKPNDAGFQALKNAYLTNGNLRLAILTGAMNGEAAEGPVGDFVVTNFNNNQELTEGVKVPVTVKLSLWDKWLQPPVTTDQLDFTVPAASIDTTVVGTFVAALGADMTGETLKFTIDTQSTAGVFAIVEGTGVISVLLNTNLGAAGTVHTLTIKMEYVNTGLPYALANCTITVAAAA